MMKIPPAVAVPLQMGSDGAIRVGNTRILLELVIYAFRQGETPEGIIDSYPSLTLADVYAVIAYYLTHREEVDSYIRQIEAKGKQLQAEIEAKRTPEAEAVRARMRAILQNKNRTAS